MEEEDSEAERKLDGRMDSSGVARAMQIGVDMATNEARILIKSARGSEWDEGMRRWSLNSNGRREGEI